MVELPGPSWLAALVATATIISLTYGGMVTVGKLAKRRIRKIVQPMLLEHQKAIDAKLLVLEIGQAEMKAKVDSIEDVVTNGLSDDVTYLRNRIDGIYNHLIP